MDGISKAMGNAQSASEIYGALENFAKSMGGQGGNDDKINQFLHKLNDDISAAFQKNEIGSIEDATKWLGAYMKNAGVDEKTLMMIS